MSKPFSKGIISGVVVKSLKKYIDERGWLCELFRHDEMEPTFYPVMSYVSMSKPYVARGPHEHVDQADLFAFLGPGNFKMTLWDNRQESPTYWYKMIIWAGEDDPKSIIVPKGVVHAYQNTSISTGMVYNFPNQLYMGQNKKSPIDEIRHEDDPNTPFKLDPLTR